MFRAAKYYLIVRVYKRAKYSIAAILISIAMLILTSIFFSDLMSLSGDGSGYIYLFIKWAIWLVLLGIIIYHTMKITGVISSPFSKEEKTKTPDIKKENIIAKDILLSRSDRILNKYRSQK